jgi:hypothetical protein
VSIETPVTVHAVIGWLSNELVVDAPGKAVRATTDFPAREAEAGNWYRPSP